MKLKADLFPYPVLNNELDDIINSEFSTEITYDQISASNIEINISFSLSDDTIQRLIEEGRASYAVHLEGVASSFRKYYLVNDLTSHKKISLNADDISSTLHLSPVVVATDTIHHYHNPNFNRVYYGDDFSIKKIEKGDILAFEETTYINFDFVNRQNPNAKSMIRVTSKDTQYMTVDSDGDKILVSLPKKAHTAYVNLSQSNEVKKNMLMVTVILPALSHVINQIKNDEVEKERHWFIALSKMLNDRGYDMNMIKTADALIVAQELLDLPVENSLFNYYEWEESKND